MNLIKKYKFLINKNKMRGYGSGGKNNKNNNYK